MDVKDLTPEKVGDTWDGEDVFEGEYIWTLKNGDIVFDDTDCMEDYLREQVKRCGGVDKWVREDIEGNDAMDFIMSLLNVPLDLVDVFESYYGGERREAEL